MKIVQWNVIRKPVGQAGSYEKRCMKVITDFALPQGIALEFVDTGSEEALALEATAGANQSQLYPVVVIVENDGKCTHIRQPDTAQLEALHRRFGQSNPTWGGKPARPLAARA